MLALRFASGPSRTAGRNGLTVAARRRPGPSSDGPPGVAAERFEQFVFQRHEELAAAGVALAAGAADELAVDALGLVPLGAEHVQAAGRGHRRRRA